MKKLLSLAALLCLLLMLPACSKGGPGEEELPPEPANALEAVLTNKLLRVATCADIAPYAYQAGEQLLGSEIELARWLAEQLGVEVELVNLPLEQAISAPLTGGADITIAALDSALPRPEGITMTTPYFGQGQPEQCLLFLASKNYAALSEISGTVAVRSGSLAARLASAQLSECGFQDTDSLDDAVRQLVNGQVSAVAMSQPNAAMYIAHSSSSFLTLPLVYQPAAFAIAVPGAEAELLAEINRLVEQMESEGLYNGWLTAAE